MSIKKNPKELRNKPYELRNIERLKPRLGKKTDNLGWWVRFLIENERISESFSDNKFGGKEKALKAAQIFRDAMERKVRPKQTEHKPNVKTKRNRSGIVGVNRTKNYWQTHWTKTNGEITTRKFSIKVYGEKEALRMAIEARTEGLAKEKKESITVFVPPQNTNIKIWRYMDFTKYISILETKSLYFPLISELNDPFEGSFSKGNKRLRPLLYKHFKPNLDIGTLIKKLRSWVAVSCWHMSEHESAAMWNLYSKSEEAICIQSTYGELRNALGVDIEIGTVQYIDYDNDWIPEDHPLLPFLYKRRSFEHESEIRAIINLASNVSLNVEKITDNIPERGILKKVKLQNLIHKIYIAPNSAPWFYNLVKNISITYGLKNIEVIQSSLEKEPFY